MNREFLTRRALVSSALTAGGSWLLSGCTSFLGQAGSSHAGRRQAGNVEKPLVFSAVEGLAKINATRASYGLAAFTADPKLQNAAQTHANLMAKTGNYGHEFGPGTRFPARMAAVDFNGSAGENIGVGYGSIDEAIRGWLESPRHRKILLRRDFDRAGFAYSFNHSGRNQRYTHFWVLDVGKQEPPGGRYIRVI